MAVNRERKTVCKRVDTIDVELVTLGNLLKEVTEAITKWGENAIVQEYQRDYSNDYSQGGIFVDDVESDVEYITRIADETRWSEQQDARDMKEFARLKAKFHNTSID
jgi:hypothetical protein